MEEKVLALMEGNRERTHARGHTAAGLPTGRVAGDRVGMRARMRWGRGRESAVDNMVREEHTRDSTCLDPSQQLALMRLVELHFPGGRGWTGDTGLGFPGPL